MILKYLQCHTAVFFFTDSPTAIIVALAKYKDIPFTENAKIIINGIKIINVWSFSIKSFLIAGSSSHAIAEVLAATNIEKIPELNKKLKHDI